MVVAGALGCCAGSGIVMLYAFPQSAVGFAAQFGWDRSVAQYCLTSFLIANGFGMLALGHAINRWGVRKAALLFMWVFVAAVAAVATLPGVTALFLALFFLVGFSGAAATAMPYAVAVSGWFDRNRGLALGLLNTGAGFGSMVVPFYARYLNDHWGWRGSFVGIALFVALLALSGLHFLVRDPPIAVASETAALAGDAEVERHFLRQRAFWLIAIAILGISVAVFGVMGSLVPLLHDRGIRASDVASVLSIAGLSSWFGRVVVGYLLDRVFAPHLAALTFVLALLGVACVSLSNDNAYLVIGAALIGLTLGAEGDLLTFLVSRYFSPRRYSRVLGAMWIGWAWGGGIGSYVAGTAYRLTHSYHAAEIMFAVLLAIAALSVCALGPYAFPQRADEMATSRAAGIA
jgi:predicted MFS family arabinose efflux permease